MNAVVFIPLTQGKVAVIDFEDFEKVRAHKWCAQKVRNSWYALSRADKGRQILLHRFLYPEAKEDVNHTDGDGLNNTRQNLTQCSHAQNMMGFQSKRLGTSSKFRGVSWHAKNRKWRALIKISGTTISIGCYTVEEDAARAYDRAARKYFGEFASPNFK